MQRRKTDFSSGVAKTMVDEPAQAATDLRVPAVDTAFVEMIERCDFHWPEGLAVECVHVGIAEIAAAALVLAIGAAVLLLAGFVVFAWRAICIPVLDQSF
jgi:hypothetical protein